MNFMGPARFERGASRLSAGHEKPIFQGPVSQKNRQPIFDHGPVSQKNRQPIFDHGPVSQKNRQPIFDHCSIIAI
jgi:hypothetical protein